MAERRVTIDGSDACANIAYQLSDVNTIDVLGPGSKSVVVVKLYRPFNGPDFVAALPPTTRAIAVLDRTKERGAIGEPLWTTSTT